MSGKPDVKLIVSNITNGKRFSHCRLCLKTIEEDYVRFGDGVVLDIREQILQPLSDILVKLLGPEVIEEIPGIDAVCTECVVDALRAVRFIETCHKSTSLLNNVLDNLLQTLNVQLEDYEDHSMYVVVEEDHSELILMTKDPPENQPNVGGNSKITCDVCSEEFTNPEEYYRHCEQSHDQVVCERCWQTFQNTEEINNHLCSKKLKCPDCKQYRNSEESLVEHHNRIHKIHICKECGKSFQGSVKLRAHEEKHFNKSNCPKCGKSYSTKDFYLKHVKLCENGLLDPHPIRTKLHRPYLCKECGKSYSTPGGLRVHYRFEHGDGKPHVCPLCNKKFTAPSYLKVHMVTHTKEKNFICSICSNRFVSKEALLYHTRRHTGEKPYTCEHCFERFVNASARAEHIKFKHVGPTLMCEICSRKFVTPHFLKMHIKRHHEKDSDWSSVEQPEYRATVQKLKTK